MTFSMQHALRLGGFFEQDVERRNIRVPFDQGRQGTKTLDRGGIQFPYRVSNGPAVGIDQAIVPAFILPV